MEEDASLQIIWRIRAACQSRSNTMHECNRLFDMHIYTRCGYMCWRAQSTGRILSHHCRSGNCAGRSIKRGSALGFHRGNLQRWTSLPVYYQVVYFTVVRLYVWAPRDLSFSLSSMSPFDVFGTTDAHLLHLPLCPSLLPAMHLPEHTGRRSFCRALNDPQQLLFPLVFSTTPLLSRSNRILDAFSSLFRAALLVPTWLRGTYYAYSCKLRSSDHREYGETTRGIISEHII